MQQESLYINDGEHQLHLRHIVKKPHGIPVLMLHGTMENGKIFYTESGRGLGCYLAEHGFDVYVADFRGKGLSKPPIAEDAEHGQWEMINHDIPLFIDFIKARTKQPMHIVCHSWGGVLLKAFLARNPDRVEDIARLVFFGTKRVIHQTHFKKKLKIDWFWRWLAPKLAKHKRYIDLVKLKAGSDNETFLFLQQSIPWLNESIWQDSHDNFNYHDANKEVNWPASWHLTGINDSLLGHPEDVKHFIAESNPQAKFSVLSVKAGNLVDYDHINILTHKLAVKDHFPKVLSWLNKFKNE
ncbi:MULTISPECIES: alpha/beta fold hydrolase [Thalassotalea]|uniref:Alpha/beta fold hydrolase n=1 Tax=Thalassotalea castellviae TaxID=3075612 RepID=A0ABU3A3L8_9GAMM|nr:alpha/beta fold hydrolase [Thalassotalea sp. W431]MDT0604500.1 alpha/beta fold hydrolase [Thalassotalea sp. W431]